MHNKITYTCKNCGWFTCIIEQWADLRPKRCMNRKCKTSFLKNPELLDIKKPEKKKEQKSEPKKPKYNNQNKNKKHEKEKRKESSEKLIKTIEQQTKEESSSEYKDSSG